MFASEITVKIVRSGDSIHEERTLKQVAKALDLLKLKEHVPMALEAYLNQYPGLKQINMRALVSRVRDLFPPRDQNKVSFIVREWLNENADKFTVDGSVIRVKR